MMRKTKKFLATMMAIAMMAMMIMENPITAYADEDLSEYSFTTGQLDPEFYANTYPDIAQIVGRDPLALFRHYAEYGIYEGRIPYAGAQPGEPINGYIETPNATADAAIAGQDNGVADTRDLSDWAPEQLAMLAQKQAEFDASGLVHVGWTEEQVQAKLLSLKEVYPEGTKVGICEVGAGKISTALYGRDIDWMLEYEHDGYSEVLCDKSGKRVMPVGFPDRETKKRASGDGNIRDVRVGDTLCTIGSGAGHVMIVLSHDEKGITVVESNQNGDEKMHWGRRISWNELENGGNNIYKAANKWTEIVHRKY